jgi:hypothetical protein
VVDTSTCIHRLTIPTEKHGKLAVNLILDVITGVDSQNLAVIVGTRVIFGNVECDRDQVYVAEPLNRIHHGS